VKNYPIWTVQLDKESTLIVVDQIDAMALWGTLEKSKFKPMEPSNVLLSGLEVYEADQQVQSRYGGKCPSTLFNLNHFSFLVGYEVQRFTIISVPKAISLTTFDGFAHGLVIMVNTAEVEWEAQLGTVWAQGKDLEGIKALVAYSDPQVENCALWAEIREKAGVIKMGLLTQQRLQDFYGQLGRICKENRQRLSVITAARKVEASAKRVLTGSSEAPEDKKRKCLLM